MKSISDTAPSIRNQTNLITFISSNDFDYLIGQLKGQLYAKSNILTRKLLVVPGDEPLRLYERNSLDDPIYGINFGYRSVNLNLAIDALYKSLNRKSSFPKKRSLEFALLELIEEKLTKNTPAFEEIKNYLNKENYTFSFFRHLAENFNEYGLYGIKEDVPNNLKWQKILYEELRKIFDWPIEAISKNNIDQTLLAGFEVHIFGFCFLPSLYLDFFKYISSMVPIYFYLPQVSKELSLDFISDRAQFFFENKIDPLDKNPLLANFQVGSKSYLKFLIDESSYQREAFFLKNQNIEDIDQEKKENLSLKEAFTLSLIEARVLKGLEKQKVNFLDDLLVFQSPNLSREVESMMLFFKEKIAKKLVNPDEIIVVCPNLQEYAPLLVYHFEKNQLNYFIDHKKSFNEKIIDPVIIFQMIMSRFSIQDLLNILTCKSVFDFLGIEEKEVSSIKKLIKNSSITFAYNQEHRLFILKNCDQEDLYIGTVKHFFDQIYIGSVFSSEQLEKIELASNKQAIDGQFLQAIGKFHYLLEQMNSFREEILKSKKNLRSWIKIALGFFSLFFDETFCLELSKSFDEELKITKDIPINGQFFYEICKEKLESKKIILSSKGEKKIYCSPCAEGVYLGKKLIWVLGADDENLPKVFERNSLDIANQEKIIAPLNIQKAIFLQMIGLNSSFLVFSYSVVGADQKDKILSLFVQKILHYIDYYFIGKNQETPSSNIIRVVKDYVFSPEGFYKGHFNKQGYLEYLALKKPKLDQSFVHIEKKKQDLEVIDIKELELLFKNPVRFFVQKSLNIYFSYSDEKKEFHLPSFQKIHILQKSIEKDIDLYFSQLKFSGVFPQYGFSSIFLKNLKSECKNFQKEIKKIGLDTLSARKILLKKECKTIESSKKNIIKVPSIELRLDCGKVVQIVGDIQEASLGVFFIPLQLEQDNLFRYWPKILAYNYCSKLLDENQNFLLTQDLKSKKLFFKEYEKELKNILNYYFLAKENVCFFYLDIIKKFFQEDDSFEKIRSIINEKMNSDSYLKFFSFNDQNFSLFIDSIKSIINSYENWFKGEF